MAKTDHSDTDLHMAMRKAEQLEEISARLSDLADSQLGAAMQNLSYGWKGENAHAYLQKGARLQNKIKDSAKEIRSTAEELRSAAKRMYRAGENN